MATISKYEGEQIEKANATNASFKKQKRNRA